MLGALPDAMMLAGKIVFCALISFVGAFLALSAWFDRKISGSETAILLTGVLVVQFIGFSLSLRGGPGMLLLAVAILGTPLIFYGLAKVSDKRLVTSFDEEDIAKYRAALDFDPKNIAAHSYLADTYRRQGKLSEAIEEYKAALQLDPSLKNERYWVQRLGIQLESAARKEMVCPRCNSLRVGEAQVCPECGRLYSTVETSMHAIRALPLGTKIGWAALVAAAFGGLIALVALVPVALIYVVVAGAFIAPLTVVVLDARRRRASGGS